MKDSAEDILISVGEWSLDIFPEKIMMPVLIFNEMEVIIMKHIIRASIYLTVNIQAS